LEGRAPVVVLDQLVNGVGHDSQHIIDHVDNTCVINSSSLPP
jgi:hypothetical protein